jgi:hypothetical protein
MILSPVLLPFNHSYAAETAYKNYKEGRIRDDPLDIDWIVSLVKDYTEIDYSKYFEFNIKFEIHKVIDEDRQKYEELRDNLFETKSSISGVLGDLSKYAQSIYKDRNIFRNLGKLYTSDVPTTIYLTDLKIDLYLKSEIERVITETNYLTGELYNAQKIS